MSKLLTNRWLHTLILLGLLVGSVLVRVNDYNWIKSLRYMAFDTYNQLHPRPPTDMVVLVDIDENSLRYEGLGQWPWPRTVMADLVTKLDELGAKVVIFDIVFAEKDRTSPEQYLKTVGAKYDVAELQQQLSQLPGNDELFAQAIRDAGNVVTGFTRATTYKSDQREPHLSQPIQIKRTARDIVQHLEPMLGVSTNLTEISSAAAGNGSFSVSPSVDGLIRQVPLLLRLLDGTVIEEEQRVKAVYPALSVEALRVMQGAKTNIKLRDVPNAEAGFFDPPYKMKIGEYEVPLNKDGKFYVYYRKGQAESYVPAWKIFSGSVDESAIRDKIVIIGTTAEGLRDIRSTPLDLFITGSEVHINVMEQILTENFLLRPGPLEGAELIFIFLIGMLIIFFAPFIGAIFMAAFTLTLIAAMAFTSWYMFEIYGLLLDPVYPSLCLFTLFVMSSLLTYIRTEAERKQVREAFGFYISPDFMEELTKDPEKLKLGGDTRELTVMFTDIRNFTSISETMSPEALIQLMNDFLTPMSDLVMNNRGTIDKYMGDAMMAFWNAPLEDEAHASHACATALKMNQALEPINEALQKKAEEEGKPPLFLEAGIGVNTGIASVGNMGSKQRFAYSALGDTVNLASRLEGQTKQYGVRILIGEKTRSNAPEFATLELDLIRVKGKKEPERIFVLLGDKEMQESEYFRGWKAKHDAMMEAYRGQRFAEAFELAAECQAISGDGMTGFYKMFMTRLEEMKANPPPSDWDGVFVATTK